MHEKSLESFEASGLNPRNIGIIVALLMLCIMLWGTFVIVPTGSRGVVLWWGSVEKRIMNEGLNFKVPMTETVIKVDVRVQPHPFREIDASSKEYQIVKMTGMMNFHIDPAFVHDLYQKVGLDFADKVIDPAFNDFVKEVVPTYPIGEILPKREEIRQTAMKKLGNNLSRYHIIVDDIYFANIRFSQNMRRPSKPNRWPSSRSRPKSRSWPTRDRGPTKGGHGERRSRVDLGGTGTGQG
jgi:regulator of protease activity HflC (stomatin/prohibitin superfamily)